MPIGDWMQTFTGKKFWPMDPNPDDICIEDIAHALSNICRYGGHSKRFYSVAEHSINVSIHVDEYGIELEALLDDAAEAYIGDMIRPIKYSISDEYCKIENDILAAIRMKFSLIPFRHPRIIEIDNRILLDEADQVMGGQIEDWNIGGMPLGLKIEFMPPEVAEKKFLDRFDFLTQDVRI